MTMAAGSVTVASDETETGSGAALVLYLANKSSLALPMLPTIGDTSDPFAPGRPCNAGDVAVMQTARLSVLRETARQATANAQIITYLLGNAQVDVTIAAGTGGLQRLPATFVANADTQGPSVDKHFTGGLS